VIEKQEETSEQLISVGGAVVGSHALRPLQGCRRPPMLKGLFPFLCCGLETWGLCIGFVAAVGRVGSMGAIVVCFRVRDVNGGGRKG